MSRLKAKKSFTSGPIFIPMLNFVIPVMLTSVLQVLYNTADKIVVGQFSGDPNALAAIGCTASLATLFVNFVVGTTSGAGIAVSHAFGAGDDEKIKRIVSTSFVFSLVLGFASATLGAVLCKPLLLLMGTKNELMKGAMTYMFINCIGIPASAIYNTGAAVLRSTGDSKTPLYILSSTGISNVLLNIVFVVGFGMSVDGVAIATVVAKYLSAIAILVIFVKRKEQKYFIDFKNFAVDGAILKKVARYGLPMGIQSSLFSVSNVFVTSAVNTFPTTTISARSIANSVDNLLNTALNAYTHASMTFVGQNFGAKKETGIKRSILTALVQVITVGTVLSVSIFLAREPLASIYIDPLDPNKSAVLKEAIKIISFMIFSYIISGVMYVFAGTLRGLGFSFISMIINLIATCGLRILWIVAFFPIPVFNNILGLLVVYPISWGAASIVYAAFLLLIWKKIKAKCNEQVPIR